MQIANCKLQNGRRERCPCCGGAVTPFYFVANIPVHSGLVFDSADEAKAYPRDDLQLGCCGDCGFICNVLWDESVRDYGAAYEVSQTFSPRFNGFQESLARWLIERFGLRRKRVIEIGCGRGEFLAVLCELGDNRGIGLDPSFCPQRGPADPGGRLTFIADYYDERYAHLEADFICCRHTLEHIGQAGDFVRMVRKAVGGRDTVVFFEVPDVLRVLREAAFWDIYYEHCSYFTAGSLGKLFRSAGFEPQEVELDYGGQYILLSARPGIPDSGGKGEHGEQINLAVATFAGVVADRMAAWRERIGRWSRSGRPIAVWGSGSKCVAFLTSLGLNHEIGCVVDVNPHRQGKFIAGTGHRIDPPEALRQYQPGVVIAMNPLYLDEIRAGLDRMATPAELIAV